MATLHSLNPFAPPPPQAQVRLELLDVGQDGLCGQWGRELPLRLRELCSHWLCRWAGGERRISTGNI